MSVTPMMAQYRRIKQAHADAILFFRLGDFYEMFYEDAIEGSRILSITLTARNKGLNAVPMCGVPFHAADNYIAKLIKAGKKVAICEQLTDASLPGIVERDVIRIITPGTLLDENALEQKANNYVMALIPPPSATPQSTTPQPTTPQPAFTLAYADITTGEFKTANINTEENLVAEIERVSPKEIIIPALQFEDNVIRKLRHHFSHIFFFPAKACEDATELLIDYLQTTQKTSLQHLQSSEAKNTADDYMCLDEATLKNLELVTTLRENQKQGSLLWVLDKTSTAMGGRLLRSLITRPLINKDAIQARLDAVEILMKNPSVSASIQEILKQILDIERMFARLSMGRGNARDLIGLKNSLQKIPEIQHFLQSLPAPLLQNINTTLDPLAPLVQLIEKAIAPDPPLALNQGNLIAPGYNPQLDELHSITRETKHFMQQLLEKEIARTGIPSLKISYNKVFGYYLEVSKTHLSKVPSDYIRKQTLANAERYITPQLKEFEEEVLGAEEKIITLEQQIFQDIREQTIGYLTQIQRNAQQLARLDVLTSFARVALQQNYCKPTITSESDIVIEAGRHPVVECMNPANQFITNNTALYQNNERLMLITGPNMGGKSTYLRQVALITLMAHLGSFVPASSASIGLVDRIFTRVGASDNLIKGQSTFMVEMQETAHILANASDRSLIILDEIGRGTSTYDGVSIAWAILDHIHHQVKAKTLFATHYHELIAHVETLPHAANYSVAVRENQEEGVVFLYTIIKGGIDKSYGLEVAKLAGIPSSVVVKAKEILSELEHIKKSESLTSINRQQQSLSSHAFPGSELIQRLQALNINQLTPLQALQTLEDLQKNTPFDK